MGILKQAEAKKSKGKSKVTNLSDRRRNQGRGSK